MARSKSLAALVAIGAALSASAAAEAKRPRSAPGLDRGLDSLNQPVVQRTDFVMDVAAHDDGLSAVERARLDAWFASLGLGYGDRVFVEEGYGRGPASHDVARVAAEYGILLSEGAPITAGEVAPGSARIIVSRSTASVPGCPNWRRSGPSSTSANYGCAMNSNLAAMIADPNDLVLGQSGSIGGGDAGTKAIKVYRETAPTGTRGLTSMTTGGKN
jgi:pilus assembly protein CpaD